MKILEWNERETLLPNYETKTLKPNETEIIEMFETIKNAAIQQYKLEGLNNEEIEEALFGIYNLQLQEFKDNIDKIIFLDYASNFIDHISKPLTQLLTSVKPGTQFKDNQNLFKGKQKLTTLNRSISRDSFNKYFCTLENGSLINKITKEEIQPEEDYLEEIKDREDNLFEQPGPKEQAIRSRHYLKENNYNLDYWKGYIRYIQAMYKNLLDYFKADNKEEELEDFRAIADIYYLYATYYKMINQLNNEKRKTK